MNRTARKSPFIIRTIVILVLIYCIAMLAMTLVYARQYRDNVGEMIRKQTDEIAEELRTCTEANQESCEYINGFNKAQAAAIMRYYQFMKKAEFRKLGVTFDAAFYETDQDEEGRPVSFKEVLPDTPVMTASPFSKNGKIIVFSDVFSKKQMEQLEDILEKGQLNVYIEKAKGYTEGCFFLPVEIEIGSNGQTIRTGYRDDTKKLTTASFQDIQIIGPGDRRIGGHSNEEIEKSSLRENAEYEMQQDLKDGVWIGSGRGTQYVSDWKAYYSFSSSSRSGRYFVDCRTEAKPVIYAFSRLKGTYLISFILFFILGGILIGGHNKVIERQFETEEKRRRMMDAMAHELKTPLGIIKNYGELLVEAEEAERKNQFAEVMVQEADHMNQAVVSMLDLSKMEAGTYPLELSSISAAALAEKEAKRIDVLRMRKDLYLELKLQPVKRILADEKLVRNILSNFLSNAIVHTNPGGTITLEVRPDGKDIYIGVRNQGSRISKEDMDRIWNRFYRCGPDQSRQDGGSGLGLAIVRNACLMHGGSYGCENDEEGVTFWAKIGSMENKLKKAEFLTGPVTGITGQGVRLRGLMALAFGFVIQGIFSWDLYGAGIVALFRIDWGYIDTFFTVMEAAGVLTGGLIMLAGAFFLRRQLPEGQTVFIAVLAAELLTAVVTAVSYGYITAGHIESELLLPVCKLLLFAGWLSTAVILFRTCVNLAKKFDDRRFVRKLIWKAGAYILFTAGFILLAATGVLWNLNIYYTFNPVLALIHIFAAYAWIQTYRRYNNREALNSL